ncbi:MAG: glycosyltransferase [Chthonomonas sp.]|nr:glycosyltransferase [Chthonomonas sp.]
MISIIMPSYGHARFVGAAVRSVLAQTFTDWELVIVDDCSPDQSLSVLREFDDPRIRLSVNERNLGAYATEQRALEMTRHDLVAVLNSDDLWSPEKLAVQAAALQEHPAASFCFVRGWVVDGDGKVDEADDVHGDWPVGLADYRPWLVVENRILASGVVFRRAGLRFATNAHYSGDWMALLEASNRGPGIGVADRLTQWRIHGSNSFTRSPKQVAEEIAVREAIRARDWPADCRAGLGRNALNLFTLYLQTGQRARALALATQVVRTYPEKAVALRRVLLGFMPQSVLQKRLPWTDSLANLPAAGPFTIN